MVFFSRIFYLHRSQWKKKNRRIHYFKHRKQISCKQYSIDLLFRNFMFTFMLQWLETSFCMWSKWSFICSQVQIEYEMTFKLNTFSMQLNDFEHCSIVVQVSINWRECIWKAQLNQNNRHRMRYILRHSISNFRGYRHKRLIMQFRV